MGKLQLNYTTVALSKQSKYFSLALRPAPAYLGEAADQLLCRLALPGEDAKLGNDLQGDRDQEKGLSFPKKEIIQPGTSNWAARTGEGH